MVEQDIRTVSASTEDNLEEVKSVSQMRITYLEVIDKTCSYTKASPTKENTPIENGSCFDISKVSTTQINTANTNVEEYLESRPGAFFRMIGMPIVAPDYSVYLNLGFDPYKGLNAANTSVQEAEEELIKKYSEDELWVSLVEDREILFKDRVTIFKKQDVVSSIYAIAMRYTLPFGTNIQSLSENIEIQNFQQGLDKAIEDRTALLNREFSNELPRINAQDLAIITSPKHSILPLMADPKDLAVISGNRQVCVPFLPRKSDTKLENNVFIKRPTLELIIKLRLRELNQNLERTEVANAALLITGGDVEEADSNQEVKNVLLSLIGTTDFSQLNNNRELIDFIKNSTPTQQQTLILFNKMIRKSIVEMTAQINEFDLIRNKDKIFPLPDARGPEYGGNEFGVIPGKQQSLDQQKIAIKKIQQLNSQRAARSLEENNAGEQVTEADYAQPTAQDAVEEGDNTINTLERRRRENVARLMNALRVIESVTGEVSGLGLVDVFVIYSALWAIDIESLVTFLDETVYQRLINSGVNDDIKSSVEQARDQKTIQEALEDMYSQMALLYSFANQYQERIKTAPFQTNSNDLR